MSVPTIARDHHTRVLPTLPLPGFGTSVRSVPVRHAAPHVFSGHARRNSALRSAIVGRLAWSGSGNEAVASYADTPIGLLVSRGAYGDHLCFVLHHNRLESRMSLVDNGAAVLYWTRKISEFVGKTAWNSSNSPGTSVRTLRNDLPRPARRQTTCRDVLDDLEARFRRDRRFDRRKGPLIGPSLS